MTSLVQEFIGIYDADSTLKGEVSYWIGARLGRTHCALCDITHGLFTQKSDWKKCRQDLEIPFHTYHRNDAPADALTVAQGVFPVVLERTNTGISILLGPEDLENFNGSATLVTQWLQNHLASHS